MSSKQLDKRLEKRIEEVKTKMVVLKDELVQQNNPEVNSEIKSSLNKLNKLSDEIENMYQNASKKDFNQKLKTDEFEKNVFNSIQSFKDAYRKAGSLFERK